MYYIIMDLEWNQPLTREQTIQSPVPLHGEIIQIGAIKTDESFNFIEKIKISVCPKFYKVMNKHVEKITGITSTQLTFGEIFPQAFKRLKMWCGDDFRFITWGFDDIAMLSDNLAMYGLDTEYGKDYINLQLIYNKQVDGERKQWSLSDAAERLGIPMDVKAHDALNDAMFTYEVCKKLDMQKGIAEYAQMPNPVRTALRKDIIKNVANMRRCFEDARVRECRCPKCERLLVPRDWVFSGGGKKNTIAACPEHGDFIIKITCGKVAENNWTISRTVYECDEEAVESYTKKLTKQRERLKKRETEKKNDNNGNV